jgi:alpha-mannosidase
MFTPHKVYLERLEKWLSPIYWSDINLRSVMTKSSLPVTTIFVHEPASFLRPNISEIINSTESIVWKKCCVGDSFGPSWTTKWFKIGFCAEWCRGKNLAFRWDSNSEAMLYTEQGRHVQAFSSGGGDDRRDMCLLLDELFSSDSSECIIFFVEMACNDLFGNGDGGMIRPANLNRMFTLSMVEMIEIDMDAYELYWDMKTLYSLGAHLEDGSSISVACVTLACSVINSVNLHSSESLRQAHATIQSFLCPQLLSSKSGGTECSTLSFAKYPHTVYTVGHCHIDTAWLWPYAETRRKVARSWATQLKLLKEYSGWNFVASQSVHWEWLRQDQPTLFEDIMELVRAKRFIPVGGSYVEFDANIPSSESFIRQFLLGRQFFRDVLHVENKVFWLPDTFGYSGQLPQILQGFGIKYFLSQKLSWNLSNK